MMPPNVQEQVVERVGAMETTPLAQVELVANTLGAKNRAKGSVSKSFQEESKQPPIC